MHYLKDISQHQHPDRPFCKRCVFNRYPLCLVTQPNFVENVTTKNTFCPFFFGYILSNDNKWINCNCISAPSTRNASFCMGFATASILCFLHFFYLANVVNALKPTTLVICIRLTITLEYLALDYLLNIDLCKTKLELLSFIGTNFSPLTIVWSPPFIISED